MLRYVRSVKLRVGKPQAPRTDCEIIQNLKANLRDVCQQCSELYDESQKVPTKALFHLSNKNLIYTEAWRYKSCELLQCIVIQIF